MDSSDAGGSWNERVKKLFNEIIALQLLMAAAIASGKHACQPVTQNLVAL
jgi:hypothetical protein